MIKETKEGFKIQVGSDGSELLIIESSKLEACIKYVLDGNINAIIINHFQGYELSEINFLNRLTKVLEGLHIPETKFDLKGINSLHKLRFLGLADNKKDVVDLINFPNLENLACDYSIRLRGLEYCKNLKFLSLTRYKTKTKDLSLLPSLPHLKELSLFITDIDCLQGIEKYGTLKKLELFRASKLETIKDLETLPNSIEEIQIEQSKKIQDYEILGNLHYLEKIILSDAGEIKTLSFLKTLPNLKFISFVNTNVLDGDLSFCEGIEYVGFINKRHYSHKFEQFNKS